MCTANPDTLRAGVSFGAEMEMSELVIFLPSPSPTRHPPTTTLLRGACKTCDFRRRLHRVRACACGGSHAFPSACSPVMPRPASRRPSRPPPHHCCTGTHGSTRGNSLNTGAEVYERPTDFLSLFCKETYPLKKTKKKKQRLSFPQDPPKKNQ